MSNPTLLLSYVNSPHPDIMNVGDEVILTRHGKDFLDQIVVRITKVKRVVRKWAWTRKEIFDYTGFLLWNVKTPNTGVLPKQFYTFRNYHIRSVVSKDDPLSGYEKY